MENKKDIGRAFKEKLDGLQKTPSDNLWDSINTSLNEAGAPPKYRLWQNPIFLAGAVFLPAILIVLVWTGSHNPATGPVQPGTALPGNSTEKAVTTQDTISGNNDTTGSSNTLTDRQHTQYPTQGSTANVPVKDAQGNALKYNTATKNEASHSAKGQPRQADAGHTVIAGKNNKERGTVAGTISRGHGHRDKTHRSRKAESPVIPVTAMDDTNANANAKTRQENKNTMANAGSLAWDMENSAGTFPGKDNYQPAAGTAITKEAITNTQPGNFLTNYEPQTEQGNTTTQTSENPGSTAQHSNGSGSIPDSVLAHSIAAIAAADTLSLSPKDSLTVQNAKMMDTARISKGFYAFAYIAPTLYGSLPKSSSLIGPEVSGPTTSKTIFNYGASIGYQFNEKWGIRVGAALKKMELSATHELKGTPVVHIPVPYGEAFLYNDFEGINYAKGITNGAVISTLAQPGGHSASIELVSRFSFLEIPVEASYQLLDNIRWGAYLTGGASMLFVTKNEVYAQNSRGSILMGSIKGIKNTGLSGNLGLGLYYRLLPAVRFNLEPALRYHVSKIGDSNPFSFSVLAGLQYNFQFEKKAPE